MNKDEYLHMVANKISCPLEDVELIDDKYDAYIMKCYLHDDPVDAPVTLKDFYESLVKEEESFSMNFG